MNRSYIKAWNILYSSKDDVLMLIVKKFGFIKRDESKQKKSFWARRAPLYTQIGTLRMEVLFRIGFTHASDLESGREWHNELLDFKENGGKFKDRGAWLRCCLCGGGRNTILKESRIVANVMCRLDKDQHGLMQEEQAEPCSGLNSSSTIPAAVRSMGTVSSLLEEMDELVSIGCHIGVSLFYVCHTGIHLRVAIVWKPCRHFSQ